VNSIIAEHTAEVRVRRHVNSPECDVVVFFRGREMSLKCRDITKQLDGHESNATPTKLQPDSPYNGDQRQK
jgi:hypothetical protein